MRHETPAPGADYAGAVSPSETTPARPEPRRGLFRQRYARWTEGDIADIRERLRTRAVKQVAHDLGVEPSALRMAMSRAGIYARPYSPDGLAPRTALLVQLASEGLTYTQIAERMGITPQSAQSALSRARKRIRQAQQ